MATGGSDRDFNSDCNENKFFDKEIHSDRSPTNDADNENKKPGILQRVIACTLVPEMFIEQYIKSMFKLD